MKEEEEEEFQRCARMQKNWRTRCKKERERKMLSHKSDAKFKRGPKLITVAVAVAVAVVVVGGFGPDNQGRNNFYEAARGSHIFIYSNTYMTISMLNFAST